MGKADMPAQAFAHSVPLLWLGSLEEAADMGHLTSKGNLHVLHNSLAEDAVISHGPCP